MARRTRKPKLIPSLLPDVLNPAHQLRVMGRLVRRRTVRPGAPPGTLVHPGPPPAESVRIALTEYGPQGYTEREVTGVPETFPRAPTVTWLNVEGLHDLRLIRGIGERLSIHPLILEDIVNLGQRPKIEENEDYLYIVLPMLSLDPKTGTVRDEQLSVILGDSFVITFQERAGDDFSPVRERIRQPSARIHGFGPDYLAYALIDAVVDNYFSILEAIGDATEQVEAEVFDHLQPDTMHRLHSLKREMLMVRRAVWPVREMVNALIRSESRLVTDATRVYLKDVYDHAVRIIDTTEVLRDVVSGVIDLYLSTLSHRTNDVMKTLTVMASIFIPLTFIVGVYGMNFEYMPELGWRWSYPILILLMLVLSLGMLWLFRRRQWL